MKYIKLFLSTIFLFLIVNIILFLNIINLKNIFKIFFIFLGIIFYLYIIFSNTNTDVNLPNILRKLNKGYNLISYSFALLIFNTILNLYIYFNLENLLSTKIFIINLIISLILTIIILYIGIIYIFSTSVQLGIKKRILFIIFWWIPILGLYFWIELYKIISREFKFESRKYYLNQSRVNEQICATKYPILFVHGVFFRDTNYFNYWGRIPKELENNGATIFYGNQESAESIEYCGKEISKKIIDIIESKGYEKVNIIAHSKGGLDSRYAISNTEANKYIASLTTINTPHYGCDFVDFLLEKVPEHMVNKIANTYNTMLKKLGDKKPDFVLAVSNLTNGYSIEFNKNNKDDENIYYQSFGSTIKKAKGEKFPLNLSYQFVKHFDSKNDGLVALESMKWGENFTPIILKNQNGLSHGDMIDLFRINIPSFDIREFYVELVSDLKNKGF